MAKDKKRPEPAQEEELREEQTAPEEVREEEKTAAAEETVQEAEADLRTELDAARAELAAKGDQLLRLAAEFDNFRRRTGKEKENIWGDATAAAVTAFLPVYDNLERAMKQETADEAYKKGVGMTMMGLQDVLIKLGVETIPALGETFDPNLHNAVMHVEDENAGENTVVEVFQQGFKLGEKVLRFAMVKVAN